MQILRPKSAYNNKNDNNIKQNMGLSIYVCSIGTLKKYEAHLVINREDSLHVSVQFAACLAAVWNERREIFFKWKEKNFKKKESWGCILLLSMPSSYHHIPQPDKMQHEYQQHTIIIIIAINIITERERDRERQRERVKLMPIDCNERQEKLIKNFILFSVMILCKNV